MIGEGKEPTRCPLRDVPLSQISEVSTHEVEPDTSTTSKKAETVLDVALAPDGTVTVKLVRGPSDEQIAKLVGPHKLF